MNTTQHHSNTRIFLMGAIFNIIRSTEWASIGDYALKATVGGIIWLGFKLIGDYITHRYIGKKKGGLGVGAAVLALGVPFLLKLKRLADELETVTTVNIHHVSLTGMKLRVDVTLKNPTETVLKVKHPFVRMLYKETVFATSQIKDQD